MKDGDSIEARAAGGDAGAFGALMAATKGDLYRFVRRYVGDEAEAHDLLQELTPPHGSPCEGTIRLAPSRSGSARSP